MMKRVVGIILLALSVTGFQSVGQDGKKSRRAERVAAYEERKEVIRNQIEEGTYQITFNTVSREGIDLVYLSHELNYLKVDQGKSELQIVTGKDLGNIGIGGFLVYGELQDVEIKDLGKEKPLQLFGFLWSPMTGETRASINMTLHSNGTANVRLFSFKGNRFRLVGKVTALEGEVGDDHRNVTLF